MSRRTLYLEILNTLLPLLIVWAAIQDDWSNVVLFTCVIFVVQAVGLGSYLKDYREWR